MENRNGLLVDTRIAIVTRTEEHQEAPAMLSELPPGKRRTVGGDKGFDSDAGRRQSL
jgi:hypothetical protein